jgi:diguanylate cyclase (GGDEF)-like protein/PAS domain S-box-containing protein
MLTGARRASGVWGDSLKNFRPHILVAIALATVLFSGWHEVFRNGLTDLRFDRDRQQASGDVVVVAIDAPSIDRIGVWPWPRGLHAELLRQLQRAGARDIAFDIDFSSPSDPASDREFAQALANAGGSVILPLFRQPWTSGDDRALHVNRPLPQFERHAWSAVVNVTAGKDGLVRSYRLGEQVDGKPVPSMSAMLAGRYQGTGSSFLIDFGISAASIPKVSYVDVLNGDAVTLAKLRDKKVIVGGTALELGDRFSIPNGGIVSGSELQALAAESILQDRMLHATSGVVTLVCLLAIISLMMFCWRRLAAGMRVVLLAGIAGAIELLAMVLQARWPLVFDTSLLQTSVVAYLAAIALDEIDFRGLLGRIAENRFQRIAMSLGDGLVCTDRHRFITVWNPGAVAIFGYDHAEIIGKPFDTLCAVREQAAWPDAASLPSGRAVVEFEGRRKNGELFPVEACFSSWQGTDGLQYGAILRDISVKKREAERIRYLAENDSLTGLANRYTLHVRLTEMIAKAQEETAQEEKAEGEKAQGERSGVALLVIGLDAFQQINDTIGHTYGDLVLRAVADRLKSMVGSTGIAARLSGDEFAMAVPCAALAGTVEAFAGQVALAFDRPVRAAAREHRVGVSIGVAVHPHDGQTADDLLSNSHLAFCRAKATRRGSYVVFESSMREELETRLQRETELWLALERNEFELFYQPQVSLVDGRVMGAEALIRWRHPERGLVSPGEFMPVVNTSPISEPLAAWVLETGCRQARRWELAGHEVRVGVNLSPSQLHSGDLASSVAELLAATGLSPSLLELEVTEDILLLDEQRVLDIFRRIQELGVRIVFDDFGTGYASLSYLKKFPLDGLKIDRSFVFDLLSDSDDAAIVSSTVSLSKQLGLSVIAEGIENGPTADLLVRMGCEHGQGYFFGKPMPVGDFEKQFMAGRDPGAIAAHKENVAAPRINAA